jgi:hypothetical protein
VKGLNRRVDCRLLLFRFAVKRLQICKQVCPNPRSTAVIREEAAAGAIEGLKHRRQGARDPGAA